MKKYIDADKLKAHYAWWGDNEYRKIFDDIIDVQPDAVVRCKDCIYSRPLDNFESMAYTVADHTYCTVERKIFGQMEFCSFGERKDEE